MIKRGYFSVLKYMSLSKNLTSFLQLEDNIKIVQLHHYFSFQETHSKIAPLEMRFRLLPNTQKNNINKKYKSTQIKVMEYENNWQIICSLIIAIVPIEVNIVYLIYFHTVKSHTAIIEVRERGKKATEIKLSK